MNNYSSNRNTVVVRTATRLIAFFSLFFLEAVFAQTRVVEDSTGASIEIPASVQKIITISEVDLDAMLALGMKPFGTLKGRGQNTPSRYLDELTDGVQIVGDFYRPNLELLLEAEPDLILAGGTPIPQILQILPEVAPTLVTYTLEDDWKKSFRQIATLLDKQAEHDAFMQRYDSRVAKVKAEIADRNINTISVVRWNPAGPAYMLSQSFSMRVLTDLGLGQPDYQEGTGISHSDTISLEAMHLLDADYILLGTLAPDGEAVEVMEEALSAPTFKQLEAVKHGKVLVVDGSMFTSLGGPLAAMKIIDVIEEKLLE